MCPITHALARRPSMVVVSFPMKRAQRGSCCRLERQFSAFSGGQGAPSVKQTKSTSQRANPRKCGTLHTKQVGRMSDNNCATMSIEISQFFSGKLLEFSMRSPTSSKLYLRPVQYIKLSVNLQLPQHYLDDIVELFLIRLRPHLLASGNCNPLQSVYRIGHSREPAPY